MSAKVVVITGGSSGIGAALGRQLARDQHAVVLAARRARALEEVARHCDGRAQTIVADMTVRSDAQRIVQAALARHGRIDAWVNNAGQGITRMPSELTEADVDAMVAANVKSAMYGMQAVLPHFKERGSGQIVNVSSMLGRIPYAAMRSAYSGAKHFLNALTAMFREEIRQTHPDIRVSLVSPGVVYTDFGASARHGGPDSRELPAGQSAEEVAALITEIIRSGAEDVYSRDGFHRQVVGYYESLGADPADLK